MLTAFASVTDLVYSLVISRSMGSQRAEGLAAEGDKHVMGPVGGHLTLPSKSK